MARMFLVPSLGPTFPWLTVKHQTLPIHLFSNEFYAYAGFLVLLFAIASLRKGFRWYHGGLLLSFLCLLGNTQVWHLSAWLAKIPPFNSLWVFLRWRLMVLACLAFCAAQGIDLFLTWLHQNPTPLKQWLSRGLPWLLPLELVILLIPSWSAGINLYPPHPLSRQTFKLPKTLQMLSIQVYHHPELRPKIPLFHPLFQNNIGAVQGYDPLFGYAPAPSYRRYHGHPHYRGEYSIDEAPVTPTLWSPNRILFRKLPPGKTLDVNLNPGRGWSLNGLPLFEKLGTFELEKYFRVRVPPSGVVDLRYTPPGLTLGISVSILSLLVLLLGWNRERKRMQEKS